VPDEVSGESRVECFGFAADAVALRQDSLAH
jgi:hypothetical protein